MVNPICGHQTENSDCKTRRARAERACCRAIRLSGRRCWPFLSISLLVVGFFSYWYVKYDRIIEQRFRDPVFANSAKIYAGPRVVRVGSSVHDPATWPPSCATRAIPKKRASRRWAAITCAATRLKCCPGRSRITVRSRRRSRSRTEKFPAIKSRSAGDLAAYELEPQLVTSLFDAEQRSKRSLVKYDDIPKSDGGGGAVD